MQGYGVNISAQRMQELLSSHDPALDNWLWETYRLGEIETGQRGGPLEILEEKGIASPYNGNFGYRSPDRRLKEEPPWAQDQTEE